MVNEYFGAGVESSARDGAAPELNPGWVHRRMNTGPEVRCVQHSIIQHSTSTDAPKSFAGGPHALPALKLQPLTHNSNTTKNCRSIRRKKTADCSHSLPFQKTLN